MSFIKPLPFFRIFLFIYCFVNILGIVNFKIFKQEYDNDKLFLLFGIGLFGLFVGAFLARILKTGKPHVKGTFKGNRFVFLIYTINILALIGIVFTHFKNGGIVIFNDNSRFGSFFIVNVLIYSSIIINVMFVARRLLENRPLSFSLATYILFQSVMILSLGYRSPIIISLGCIGVVFFIVRNNHQNKLKKIFTIRNGIIFILLIYIMSAISAYRVAQKYSLKRYYKNINSEVVEDYPALQAFIPTLSLFRYNQFVINKLIDVTEDNHLNGSLYLSNFKALLPGSHLGARNIVGQLIGARNMPNGKPWSTTPTLQGALYVDGGYLLVFIGFFIIAFILGTMRKVIRKNPTPFNVALYAFLFVNSLVAIHTGYFDLLFYLLLIWIYFFRFVIMRVKAFKSVAHAKVD